MHFAVLYQTRTLVTIPPSRENPEGEVSVKIGFLPLRDSFGDIVTVDAETPETAFALANSMKPSRGFLMAVETLESFHHHQQKQNARRIH